MKTLQEIRKDLKEIRYYYTRKNLFDEGCKIVGSSYVTEKAKQYAEAVKEVPPKLYDLYINLYVKGATQEGLALEMSYTPEYIQMLNKRLLLFLQMRLKD